MGIEQLPGRVQFSRQRQTIWTLLVLALTGSLAAPASAHVGRRMRLDVADGKIVAYGANTGLPDGLPDVRPYAGVVHDHWKNYNIPALPNPIFASTFLPEFDVPASVTGLVGYSLQLDLIDAWKWANPMLGHHGHHGHSTTPTFSPLAPGEVIRIEGALNTWTDTTQFGSLTLLEEVPAGGDSDVPILYSINGHPSNEIHVLKMIVSASSLTGGPAILPSNPIYILLSPDGANMTEKLHHESLFLEEYLSSVPEPSSAGLLLLGFALSRHARRQPR
jgi:hypothetical protein